MVPRAHNPKHMAPRQAQWQAKKNDLGDFQRAKNRRNKESSFIDRFPIYINLSCSRDFTFHPEILRVKLPLLFLMHMRDWHIECTERFSQESVPNVLVLRGLAKSVFQMLLF
jgi:hypothetical protein